MFVCHAAARRFSVVMGNTYGTTIEHMTDFTLSAAGHVPQCYCLWVHKGSWNAFGKEICSNICF